MQLCILQDIHQNLYFFCLYQQNTAEKDKLS